MVQRPRCRTCGKFSYGREEAFNAALGTARSVGKPVRVYRCPHDRKIFHLTTKPERRKRGSG